ncbi:C-C motif chemokine 8-like [Xyrichtys novacula]|uniref:C-C motif chemokine n=1 Tax=Xyrichtys novacula TaxID=13765 RepID=A0AAV1GEH2_XYRNO|nr:C-C motif chemokine 8-like [Xyrichtys novacula]
MARTSLITMTTAILCITLGLVSLASPRRVPVSSCCTSFVKKPIPLEVIRGYGIIDGTEKCRMKAVIFYTKQNKVVCAKPGDKWVERIREQLSARLKKSSKQVSGDGSGSFTSTTETITFTTDGYDW